MRDLPLRFSCKNKKNFVNLKIRWIDVTTQGSSQFVIGLKTFGNILVNFSVVKSLNHQGIVNFLKSALQNRKEVVGIFPSPFQRLVEVPTNESHLIDGYCVSKMSIRN